MRLFDTGNQRDAYGRDEVAQATKGVRKFETGATRSADADKPDYEGFLSPLVLVRFGEYMTKHRKQADGSLRDSDNWQKGIPRTSYIKSMFRHFKDVWLHHRGYGHLAAEPLDEALGGLLFNVQGFWHETIKGSTLGLDVLSIKPLPSTRDEAVHYNAAVDVVREQMDPKPYDWEMRNVL